ncbi:SnoaL-like polyketide cyclase [Ekhidna lutea]|uniref:SnoaL-like polyketide cyclase n=1 Tax=Ekhidna lutea TaxID=447679 RepID=A0A239GL75_EKHLU|nr:ester cyclase [Ekhidna lutea]SNS69562.1 SnoaL-like polyketide cyclase [Ekhidna lutea]
MNTSAQSQNIAEKLVLEFLSRVWGTEHDLDAIDELMTEDYVITTGGKIIKGRENFKAWVADFQTKLTNAATISQDIFTNHKNDMIVSRWICSGKNNGIFGIPGDGEHVSFTGIAIWQVRGDLLSACWVERSAFELYQELIN